MGHPVHSAMKIHIDFEGCILNDTICCNYWIPSYTYNCIFYSNYNVLSHIITCTLSRLTHAMSSNLGFINSCRQHGICFSLEFMVFKEYFNTCEYSPEKVCISIVRLVWSNLLFGRLKIQCKWSSFNFWIFMFPLNLIYVL